jgi:RNA polymerase sigma factor FliA
LSRTASGRSLIEWPVRVEAALWRRLRFENDAACREAIFNRYTPQAVRIAHAEFRGLPVGGCDRQDYEQWAFSGLLEAIDRFDPLRGPPFGAFARQRIRGAIIEGRTRGNDEIARRSQARRARTERISSLLGDVSADVETGDALAELSRLVVALAIGLASETASMRPAALEDADALGVMSNYDAGVWRDLCFGVRREIDRLPAQERAVVRHHYFNGIAFCDIATLIGLTPGRISQIHRNALKRLRESLARIE